MRRITVATLLVFLTSGFLIAETQPEATRGHKWIESHEFQIMAVVEGPNNLDKYKQFGFTSLMVTNLAADGYPQKLAGFAVKNKLAWQWFYRWKPKHGMRFIDELKRYKADYSGLIGVSVGDECDDKYFKDLGTLIKEARKFAPDLLYYHALLGLDVPKYANDLNLYRAYIQKAAKVMDVDVLMYDQYPFRRKGTAKTFFTNLGVFREQAKLAGKPYWNWLQAFGWSKGPFDEPSESQLALQAYASLAYGYKGLAYWTFSSNYQPYSRSLIGPDGMLTPTGKSLRNLVPNIKKLGNALKGFRSTGIYYIAPKVDVRGGRIVRIPKGVKCLNDSLKPFISSAEVSDAEYGFLVGMFTDDKGNQYMMLVNANHGYKKTSAETAAAISVQLGENVDSIAKFDCKSGQFRQLKLSDKKLNHVVIGGGLGNLYQILTRSEKE